MKKNNTKPHKKIQSMKKSSVVILVIGIGFLLFGLAMIGYIGLPLASYSVSKSNNAEISSVVYPTKLQDEKPEKYSDAHVQKKQIPDDNRLIIPKIGVNIPIVEGSDESALQAGAWRHPNTAIPGEKGNMAISSHRFQFLPPSVRTLYLLDQVEINDDIIIYWEGKEYNYVADTIKIVDPSAVEYIEKGDEEMLTIYTCTPLFTQDSRLVVIAKISQSQYQ